MTQGVGCYEPERNMKQHSQPPVLQTLVPWQPCAAVHSKYCFQLGKNTTAAIGTSTTKPGSSHPKLGHGSHKLCFSVLAGTFSLHIYTGPCPQVPIPNSFARKWGREMGFLYLKGIFHIQGEKLYSSTDIPQPRFQSLLSVSLTLPGWCLFELTD